MTGLTGRLHENDVHGRWVRVLADHLAELIPDGASVLDVGRGDGRLAHGIGQRRPDLRLSGIDALVPRGTWIPVRPFDGRTIREADAGVDVVLLADVLHLTDDPQVLLRETARVARRAIVIKDHTRDGRLASPTLRFLDYVGNAHHGVVLPYNSWPRDRWLAAFDELRWAVRDWRDDQRLYPRPADWIFGRSLHFVARLEPVATGSHPTRP
ncbi:MAG TPA: methionine biosynthesis protein MetW [Isosphaeraceae bacterium]|jgi:SAM-dependent methyltransferase